MAYKCRAYPTPAQTDLLNRTFGCIRVVWNRTLAARQQRWTDEWKQTSFRETSAQLTAMKKLPELIWLNEVSAIPLQQVLRHQQLAIDSFFAKRARYPRFKTHRGRQAAAFTRSAFRMKGVDLWLAKTAAPLRYVWSWPCVDPATIDPTTVTVSRDGDGRWYVGFAVDVEPPESIAPTGGVRRC